MKELLKPKTIFATMFYITFCYLILRGIKVPPELNTIVSGLFGFYYGQKVRRENGHSSSNKG